MPEKYRRPHSHERVQAVARMKRQQQAQREALDAVRRFNATVSAEGRAWFWPTVAAALVSRHHWLVVACDSCGTVVDLDLRVSRATRMPRCGWRYVICNVHGAMGMAGRGSSGWHGRRRFE